MVARPSAGRHLRLGTSVARLLASAYPRNGNAMSREPIEHARRTWYVLRDRGRRLVMFSVGSVAVLIGVLVPAAAAQTPDAGEVVVLTLDGTVDPLVADYLTGEIERAQDAGAEAVLLEID